MDDTIRFEEGSVECSICLGRDGVHQLVVNNKIKGLPVQEHKFICNTSLKADYPELWEEMKKTEE